MLNYRLFNVILDACITTALSIQRDGQTVTLSSQKVILIVITEVNIYQKKQYSRRSYDIVSLTATPGLPFGRLGQKKNRQWEGGRKG